MKIFNKQIIVFCVLSLAAAGLLLSGCSSPFSIFARYVEYKDAENGFSIRFPAAWERQDGMENVATAFISPPEYPNDAFRENVNVAIQSLHSSMLMEEVYVQNLNQIKALIPSFIILEQGQEIISQAGVRWVIFKQEVSGFDMQGIMYIFIRNKRVFVINCIAATNKFPKYKPVFQKIAKSFKFNE